MVKRIIVGAHYGVRDWLVQRVTALVMAVYSLLFAAMLLACAPADYERWRALFAPQWMRLTTFVFFLCLFWHAWVGMRDILMDYIKSTAPRLALQAVIALVLAGYAGWAAQILWSA